MRLDVTALGSASRSVGQVAAAVVEYLEGRVGDPGRGLLTGGEQTHDSGLTMYYGDSREGPGRWIGLGATAHGLTGVVDRNALGRVLEGRHPHTGERLLTAQGSSQRSNLAVGTAARFDTSGSPLYTAADMASLLDLTRREVNAMIACGDIATVTVDGDRLVEDHELTRLIDAAAVPTVERITAGGDPDDWLTGPQTAQLLGVSAQYVRRLCHRGERGASGGERAQLPAERVGGNGAFRIRRGDLAEFAANRKTPVARVAFDVTLTTEKSFGVVMMLTDGVRQQRFVDALRVANDTAISYLDEHAAVARRKGEVVASNGLVGASYFHGTSRGLDPHPHHHNVIANAVVDDQGGVRALDARSLYLRAPEAEALATAAARWELRDLQLGWWQRDEGMWEIAGVDEAVINAFSSRHRDINEVRVALEDKLGRRVTTEEERQVWADTRAAKTGVDPAELLASWRQRAGETGFDVSACFERGDHAVAYERLDDELTAKLFSDLLDPATGVCSEVDRFDWCRVVQAVVDWSVDDGGVRRKVLLPPAEVTRLAGRFLAHEHVIGLSRDLSRGTIRRGDGTVIEGGEPVRTYTTAEMVWTQTQIIDSWSSGHGARRGVVDDAYVDAAIAAASVDLTGEQKRLVRRWCTSGDRVQGAVGWAGAGKTTAMFAAARAWESAGFRVIGAAVKGEAARQLGADAAIESDTLALLLTRIRRHEPVLDARTVVIVDEGSTIGDRELLELMQECERADATLRIIGDPAQHRSVPAGGCWAYLVSETKSPALTTVHRLRDAGERRRAAEVRSGKPTNVLAELEAAGQLIWSDRDSQTYAAVLERWYASRRDGAAHPMVHGRNRERRLLNQVAQQVLIADGSVDADHAVELRDGRRLCVGDAVIARHGDRNIHPDDEPRAWMRNGTTGRISAIEPGERLGDLRVTVVTDAGHKLIVGRPTLERRRGGIDLAYAVTSYAVQGSTRPKSTSTITASTSRAELYVGMTRGEDSNTVFATRTVTEAINDTDRHLPVVDRDLADELAERLARPDGVPVVVADPHVVAVSRTVGQRLATLHARRRAGAAGAWDEAIERREALLRRTAEPPPGFAAVLPPAPAAPHLTARYRRLAADVSVWTETHNAAKPRTTMTVVEQAIGARPRSDGAAAVDWDALAGRIVELATDTTLHRLTSEHPQLRHLHDAGWLRGWLDTLARRGRLASVDIDGLADRVTEIADWRAGRSIDRDELDPLGPAPDDHAGSIKRRRLREHLDRFTGIDGDDLAQGVA